MTADPFPRDRFVATLRRLPAYLRLAWALARDPLVGRTRRAAVVAAAGYLASPIDLVPGIVPVLGQLDDIAIALAALKFALAGLNPAQRQRHLETVGLVDGDLTADLRTVGVTSAWLLRAGARTTTRAARATGRIGRRGVILAATGASRAADAARAATSSPAGMKLADLAARGGSAVKGAAARRPGAVPRPTIQAWVRRAPALEPGEERLPFELEVIESPGSGTAAEGDAETRSR